MLSKTHLVIQANTAELRRLHAALRVTAPTRPTQEERVAAITRYLERYDQLALPGGLVKGMMLLVQGEPQIIEIAVSFLEADPHFHRSGYIKADLLRYLKRANLDENKKQRLRQVVLDRVKGPDTREFRHYCRLAIMLDTDWFRRALKEQADGSDLTAKRHAGWILALISRK